MTEKNKTLFAIIATGLLSFLGTNLLTGLNIAMPVILKTYDIGTDLGQLVNSAYSLIVGICILMSPYLLKRFATSQLFRSSIAIFTVGLLISGLASNFAILLTGRVIQGIAAGLSVPLMFNIIISKVPKNQRGTFIGVGTLLLTMGPALGPLYGSLVLHFFNLPWLFLLMLIVVFISLLLGFKTVEPLTKPQPIKLDWGGLILITIILSCLTFGLSFISSSVISPVISIGSLVVAVITTIWFFKYSAKQTNPILNVTVFHNRDFRDQNISFFLSQVAPPAVGFLLSIYVQTVDHNSAMVAALILLPGSLLSALISPASGTLLDKLGAKKTIGLGTILLTLGLALFVVSTAHHLGIWEAVVIYFIFMSGIGLTTGNLQTSGISSLTNQQQSDGDAFFNASQQYSGSVGTALSGTVLAAYQTGKVGNSLVAGTATGTQISFLLFLILALISDFLLFKVFRSQK